MPTYSLDVIHQMARESDKLQPSKIMCPLCESGELIPHQTVEHYCYKGHHFSLADIEYSECSTCHSELVTPEQIKHNEVRVRQEHQHLDEWSNCADSKNLVTSQT